MKSKEKSAFECVALLLQGGGALGAYQGGVYQALHEAEIEPDWVAGISIGAINAAIIAGNPPADRVKKLRTFWEEMTNDNLQYYPPVFRSLLARDETQHQLLNILSAANALTNGVHGFFRPRPLIPWLAAQGSLAATSFYDTAPLRSTMERLIDFERINKGDMRFNIGAVQVTSGNFTTFCNKTHTITAAHIMASGALPPGLPPVKIGHDYYWDGGIISNTPLKWVIGNKQDALDTLVFQVDLWSADGEFPQNMAEVLTREKDIRYSSRTRAGTDSFRERHKVRHALAELLNQLPEELKKTPQARLLREYSDDKSCNIVHLIYHNKSYEGYSKDAEFSRLNMEAHWKAGYDDTLKTLSHPEVLQKPQNLEGFAVYDFSKESYPPRKKKMANA